MLKSKKLKKLITVALTVILVIALSAGTSILVNKKGSVQSSVTVKNGLSAYELAVKNGYNGTVKDWLDSLNGKSAYQLAVSAGYNGTENEWAQSLNALLSSGVQSIKTACFNSYGQLVITLSDGTELNLGNAVGKNGADGKDGINGKDGSDGKNGTNGTDGVSISGAAVNESGELVLSFSNNKTVNVGKVVGATGIKGDKGDKGDQGEQGIQGIQGEKGEKGDTGATGATGAKGDKGDKGDRGEQGIQGIQGEKGEKGDTGATGATGAKGDKGDKGDQGEQGIQGIQGEKGEQGDSITDISITGSTMTVKLSTGRTFTFENIRGADGKDGISPKIRINAETGLWEISEDDGENWTFTNVSALGTKGDKGDTGAKGEKGDKGDQGEQGIQGIQGIQGAQGEKGDKGADGVSVTGVTINEDNKLVITLSEGDPIIIDKSVVGADGKDGNGISKVTLTEDFCLVFDYTDGTSSDKIGPIKGADGANGADGLTPILTLDDEGDLSVKYGENGEVTLLGNIKGIKGNKGDKGDAGAKGSNGVDGKSAYELYISAHPEYTGTQEEWLAALKGEKGDTGRGIAKTEIIDGYLWVTYTDDNSENLGYIGTTEKDYLIYNPIFENSVLVGYAVALNPLYMNVVPNTIIIPEQYNNMPIVKLGFTTYTNVFSNVTSRQDRYYNFTSATLREIRIPSHVKGFIAKNNFTSGLQGKFEIESIYLNDPSGWQVYDSNSKKYISVTLEDASDPKKVVELVSEYGYIYK